jgi:hypothetical protein
VIAEDNRPGLDPRRLVRLMSAAAERCSLDLTGFTVLTEAASGAYVVTPVLAAIAGAQVWALAADTPYATSPELEAAAVELAEHAGVTGRVHLIREKTPEVIGAADIVTNSGQVRPIDAAMVAQMKPTAVIPLMYESWEYRESDVDLETCRARNISVAGTNESHPAVDALAFVGVMALKQLHDAGVAVYRSRIALLCDNAFAPFIAQSLRSVGADVAEARQLSAEVLVPPCDAVLFASRPSSGKRLTIADARLIAEHVPGAVFVHYWGDVDFPALKAAGIPVWPPHPVRKGHMGVLPSAVGPEPVVRLQAGGLKVGELLARDLLQVPAKERALVQLM